MTDREFLDYCEAHADTPRCGFTPEQASRLCRLAGQDASADAWGAIPNSVHNLNRHEVRHAVMTARKRITETVQ